MSNRDSITNNFPKMKIESEIPEEPSLEGRETVEEFLARGGKIKYYPPDAFATKEFGGYETRRKRKAENRKALHDKERKNNV